MYTSASLLLVASFFCALFFAGVLLVQLLSGKSSLLVWAERGHICVTGFMTLCSAILVYAFVSYDFSLEYVAQYSDSTLPLFYRVTAFWAGQSGSLLFWGWSVALGGLVFLHLPAYQKLSSETKLWFWVFFLCVMAFFLLLLTVWNDPFILLPQTPREGRGLNPLLQNPGMIFHPPLLFLGYGGFVVPSCLALAQAMGGKLGGGTVAGEPAWATVSRAFVLGAWVLLTAGIILGAWWAYMELGWGGYWAWDPVENASLIPWLVSSAYLHTAIIESKRGKLLRTNVFLMALITISAFFATYLVRSGVVESLHAFGDGGVGKPLLAFTLLSLVLAAAVPLFSPRTARPLAGLDSREGMLVLVAWLLLTLSCIILMATLWPVITRYAAIVGQYLVPGAGITAQKVGLGPEFYNQTCLPLFSLLSLLLLVGPYLRWQGGVQNLLLSLGLVGIAVIGGFSLWLAGFRIPLFLFAAGVSIAAIMGLVYLLIANKGRWPLRTLAAHGVHLSLLLMIVGVAFSGPYQQKMDITLAKGEQSTSHGYTFGLSELYEGNSAVGSTGRPNYQFIEAEVLVQKNGKSVGVLNPQRRLYANFEQQTFGEVSTLFSLGTEVYATLASLEENGQAHISVHLNPLVNWLWIGGTLMCLFPLLNAVRRQTAQPGAQVNTEEQDTPPL